MPYIMVLSDEETYTDLPGCRILWVPEDLDTDDIEEHLGSLGDTDNPLVVIRRFGPTPADFDFNFYT